MNIAKFGTLEELEVPEGTTLEAALEEAGVDADAAIRFRGQTVEGEDREVVLSPGDTVVAAPPDVEHG